MERGQRGEVSGKVARAEEKASTTRHAFSHVEHGRERGSRVG
jgi:hypothetical protein